MAAALDAAARAGVVHRDVKPENVLLDEATGRAMLADFGIARAMAGEQGTSSTGQGVAVGTPAYMSPEQAAGEEVDSRSDLYALGVVAYEMLVGTPPFQGPNRVVVSKHIAERPAPIDRLRPDVPRPLAAAIMRALEKQPADRWQTGDAFRQALTAEQPAPRSGRRRRAALAAAAAALAVVAGIVGLSRRAAGPPAGVNPRHSILVLPFDNQRDDRAVDWLREGSVSMLGLNLSQWNDLTVVDHERLHDLLAKHRLRPGDDIGLDMARRLARDAGVWTVVLGDFAEAGDSLHLTARVYDVASGRRVDVARVDDRPGAGRAAAVRQPGRQAARSLRRAERGADRAGALDHGVARGVPRLSERGRAAQPVGPRRGRAGSPSRHSARHDLRARLLQAGAHPRMARRHGRLDRRRRDRARHRAFGDASRRTTVP